MKFAEVAVDAPTGFNRTFSYSIAQSLSIRPGHLVQVPFGARTLQGVVYSLTPVPQVPETRDVLRTLSPEPLLTEVQLSLSRWMSNYYMAPLFDAAALMFPPGARSRPRTYVSLVQSRGAGEEPRGPGERRVVEYVRRKRAVDQERLVEALGEWARGSVERLVDRQVLARSIRSRGRSIGPKYENFASLAAQARGDVEGWVAEAASRAPRQAALATQLLAGNSSIPLSDARKTFGASAVNGLLARGWIEVKPILRERDPLAGMEFPPASPVLLTARQTRIAKEIGEGLRNPSTANRIFLLQGVTGSGKTEIYLDAVERCLELGKRAVVLVPEIALTHQTVERFAARLKGEVAVLHSGLSDGERFDQWWKIKRGEYGVVIGSRGAVFGPQPELGLIVIDEEHEWTYKQNDASPRYHSRDVTLKLSELTGAVVVLGSASPDVVSYYKGLRKAFSLLTLPERVTRGDSHPGVRAVPMSSVEVVDMRQELREGNRHIFSRILVSEMERSLKAGSQAILFLNRRGSASYLQCRDCGNVLSCRRCDVALTYHRGADRLICHYCGYRRARPERCTECLGYRMGFHGVGTESVVREVAQRFPEATTLRWDRDAVKSPKSYEELLTRFRAGEAQVMVGTQMIAKGLHFPSVTLVGVVLADIGLNIPDYRAGERAFQLLCQVSGRAGRGPLGGRVVMQTYQPDNYAVRAAAAQDYQSFYTKEMASRREQGNPPFGKLIRLLYLHANSALCEREASRLAEALRSRRDESGYSDIDILGPTPAYPPRIRGRYRWHLVIRGADPRTLLDEVAVPPGWVIDVDPVSLT